MKKDYQFFAVQSRMAQISINKMKEELRELHTEFVQVWDLLQKNKFLGVSYY